jgi:peptidyl-tRNA hydrolase
MDIATRKKVQNGFVIDAGLTELKEGTITIGYVGPDYDNKIDKLTGQLKLY